MSTHPIIAEDVRDVLSRQQALWAGLKGARVFITGATGFFGTWLLETLLEANRQFSLDCRVIALSRDPNRFVVQAPHLARDGAVTWLTGDVRDFAFPAGAVTHVIHAGAESTSNLNARDPQTMFSVCVDGTRRVLEMAEQKGVERLLFTSSGAVYGQQPTNLPHVPETFCGGPDPLARKNAYAEGKRAAEFLCGLAAADCRLLHATIARCFAFVGPHLPLDVHFAAGNFIRDALAGRAIAVSGDGSPFRSYLYAPDLAEWLVTILLRGRSGVAYNVGSDEAVSIRELAERVSAVAAEVWPDRPRCKVAISLNPRPGGQPSRYVPCCARARDELGLRAVVPLDTAIRRTFLWHASLS
jgi:nucleoside-diphosphate-sugar epimerase